MNGAWSWNTIVQGAGIGFVFVPLNVVAFATLGSEAAV